jgi:hypothetical protein
MCECLNPYSVRKVRGAQGRLAWLVIHAGIGGQGTRWRVGKESYR